MGERLVYYSEAQLPVADVIPRNFAGCETYFSPNCWYRFFHKTGGYLVNYNGPCGIWFDCGLVKYQSSC